jgi:hypothetical protein
MKLFFKLLAIDYTNFLPVEEDVDHSQRKFVLTPAGVGTANWTSTRHHSQKKKSLVWPKVSSEVQLQQQATSRLLLPLSNTSKD